MTANQPHGKDPIRIEPTAILGATRPAGSYSDAEIQAAARAVHVQLWRNRHQIYGQNIEPDPVDILDPSLALRCIGLSYEVKESLGQFADSMGRFEVAGMLDRPSNRVSISRQFSPYVQTFTAAHELGHAILHDANLLHRDRPLDGSRRDAIPDRREIEANKFAAAFLLPKKQVRARFEHTFGVTKLKLKDDTAFLLASQNQDAFRASIRTPREFARRVAQTTYYAGSAIYSLAEQFHVSIETMAIRLEELALVEF